MKGQEKHNSKAEFNIFLLIKAIWKRVWLIVLVGLSVALIAFLLTKLLIAPTYRSGFTAYVNNQQTQTTKDYLTASDVNASKDLVRTYNSIIRSSAVLSSAAKSSDLNYSYSQLRNMVTTEIQGETEIIKVYVVSKDPQVSYDLALAISKNAPGILADIVEGSSMKIIDSPELIKSQYGPNYFKYAVLGFILGALAVLIKCIVDFIRDDRIKSEQDLEERFSIPILGIIPDLEVTTGTGYYSGRSDYQKSSERSASDNEAQ